MSIDEKGSCRELKPADMEKVNGGGGFDTFSPGDKVPAAFTCSKCGASSWIIAEIISYKYCTIQCENCGNKLANQFRYS